MSRERLRNAIRRKYGIRSPKPTDAQLNLIIARADAMTNPGEDEWRQIVYEVCGSDNLLLTEGQDFSNLNALLAQIRQELGRGRD